MTRILRKALLAIAGIFIGLLVQAQDTSGHALTPAQFEKRAQKKRVMVLDVRTPQEFAEGHLRGAMNINVLDSVAFVSSVQSLKKKKTYLLYCKSSKRSGKALMMMQEQGFHKLYHLAGGITAWEKPLEKTEVTQ